MVDPNINSNDVEQMLNDYEQELGAKRTALRHPATINASNQRAYIARKMDAVVEIRRRLRTLVANTSGASSCCDGVAFHSSNCPQIR